jgi:hypothetical protein
VLSAAVGLPVVGAVLVGVPVGVLLGDFGVVGLPVEGTVGVLGSLVGPAVSLPTPVLILVGTPEGLALPSVVPVGLSFVVPGPRVGLPVVVLGEVVSVPDGGWVIDREDGTVVSSPN